jgi:outer membrane beta-barrel protein
MLKIWFAALFCLSFLITTETHAGEESLYDFLWLDPDKKVYVLQNKLYKKEHKVAVDIGYISNFTSKFQDTRGLQFRAAYFFHEEWAIEAAYQHYNNQNNDDFRNVRKVSGIEPFIRRFNKTYGLNAIWSPFYGKINTFNQIFYFDWSFGAGVTMIDAESSLKTATSSLKVNTYDRETYTGAVLKTNLKFHLQENIHLGVEYMNTYYMAPSPANPKQDKLRTNTDIIVSVGFSF